MKTDRARILRVVVTGSECVGKTTLARQLAVHFDEPFVPEFAREYATSKATGLDLSDVEAIARGQIAAENRGVGEARRIVVLDTDLVSTAVYAMHYYGECPAWVLASSERRLADLYLLLDIDVPWIPDPPNRDRGDRREEMQRLFRDALEARRANVVDVRGGWGARLEVAIGAVEELLRSVGE